MQACFIGHRTIKKDEKLISSLKQTIVNLINKGVKTFLFGSMSEFDDLSWEIVTALKAVYPFIKRVYVRATYPHIDKAYEKYILESYEETYFSPKLKNAGKYSYVERNYEMIDNSTYCIFYYNENHAALLKQQYKRNSGAKIAYDYALKRNKTIINLYK